MAVPVERSLFGRDGLNRLVLQQQRIRFPQPLHERFIRRQPVPAQDGFQARLDQVLLVLRDHDAAEGVNGLADLVERGSPQLHGVVPVPSSETTVGPMRSSGRISSTWLVAAAAPGMPQTTLVASSWAITYAPLRLSGPNPFAPSHPIPVRMTATTDWV